MKISLFDKEFAHVKSYCGYDDPEHIEWDRSGAIHDIVVCTERCFDLLEPINAKIKIAWLLEPEAIHGYGYNKIRKGLHEKVDYILTFNRDLHESYGEKAVFWSPGGTWLWKDSWRVYDKNYNLSMLASTVKDWTEGHRLRSQIIDRIAPRVDLLGGYGHAPIEPKITAFKDYRYSIVIENSRVDWYWTDKLLDPLLCGTIPIFWGCPDIGKYFDTDGIIQWQTIEELESILDSIGPDDYARRWPAMNRNFETACKFGIVEDYMYKSFFKGIKS